MKNQHLNELYERIVLEIDQGADTTADYPTLRSLLNAGTGAECPTITIGGKTYPTTPDGAYIIGPPTPASVGSEVEEPLPLSGLVKREYARCLSKEELDYFEGQLAKHERDWREYATSLRSALEAAQIEKGDIENDLALARGENERLRTLLRNTDQQRQDATQRIVDLEATNAALVEVAKAAQPYRSGMILDCSMVNDMARRARLDEALANPAVQKALGGEGE